MSILQPPPSEPLPAGLQTVDEALHRTRFRVLPFLGPAFIACVAYIDPGNFATNIAGGAKFGYLLVWVIVASNLMAMLIQTLSAKLGIATRQEPARGLPRPVLAPHLVPALGPGRGDRDGDRPGRVPRRGDRLQPAARDEPARLDGAHRRSRRSRSSGCSASGSGRSRR